jgi:anti-sigma factor RsiW
VVVSVLLTTGCKSDFDFEDIGPEVEDPTPTPMEDPGLPDVANEPIDRGEDGALADEALAVPNGSFETLLDAWEGDGATVEVADAHDGNAVLLLSGPIPAPPVNHLSLQVVSDVVTLVEGGETFSVSATIRSLEEHILVPYLAGGIGTGEAFQERGRSLGPVPTSSWVRFTVEVPTGPQDAGKAFRVVIGTDVWADPPGDYSVWVDDVTVSRHR